MPYNDAAVKKAKEDLKIALGALEKTLLEKTYLVRETQPLYWKSNWLCYLGHKSFISEVD